MLLCLSSGATPRYRQDILRALSKPEGMELRFRYELDLVEEELKQGIACLVGEEVCIAYLDRSKSNKMPKVVPVRSGIVTNVAVLGDFCVLDFQLGMHSAANDIDKLNDELRFAVPTLPKWDSDANLIGQFCHRLANVPPSLMKTNTIEGWQRICKELATHGDFGTEPFFYRVEGIFNLDTKALIPINSGAFHIPSDAFLELRLLHYAPSLDVNKTGSSDTSWLSAQTKEDDLAIISNPSLAIDSGYDLKAIRMRAATVMRDSESVITLTRKPPAVAGVASDSIWDFDLPVRVTRNLKRLLWQGMLVGLLVASQGLVAIWNNEHIADKLVPMVLVVFLGLATGYVATFNLRKP